MRHPKVSVLVLGWNGKKYFDDCLGSLLAQTYRDYEVVLVDNASTDGSVEYIKKKFKNVRIMKLGRNYGFSGGYNRAIKKINSEYVVLLNQDTKVDKNFLKELMKQADSEDIGAWACRILFFNNPKKLNSAGTKTTIIGAGFDIGFYDDPKKYTNQYKCMFCGGAVMIKKKAFIDAGGFDDFYFAYDEDIDLSWRLWLRGWKIVYVPSSTVYHKFGSSFGLIGSDNRVYYGERNRICNIIKNFDSLTLAVVLPISFAFTAAKFLFFMIRFRFGPAKLLLKANINVFNNLKNLMRKRSVVQSRRVISDWEIFKKGVVLSIWKSLKEYLIIYNRTRGFR